MFVKYYTLQLISSIMRETISEHFVLMKENTKQMIHECSLKLNRVGGKQRQRRKKILKIIIL